MKSGVAFAVAAALLAALIVGGSSAGPPSGATAKIEPQVLQEIAAQGKTTFWVSLKQRADLSKARGIQNWAARGQYVVDKLKQVADQSQSGFRSLLTKRGVPFQTFWAANAIKVTAGEDVLMEIAAQPQVEAIYADHVYHIDPVTKGTRQAQVAAIEWGITNIKADQVWSTYGDRGEGRVIGSIDTGVQYDHPALVGKYRGNTGGGNFDHNYNWYDPSHVCGNPSLAPCDNNSHGTHTMGTMVGDDGAGNQIGVAPGAKWITAKGCESSSCSTAALVSSGQWMLAPTKLDGSVPDANKRPNIVSNSWGDGTSDPFYQQTVTDWVASGIFPAFANGNAGPGCTTSGVPGAYVNAYSVGAYDINNVIASFSSRGPSTYGSPAETKPNISAPGVNVRSSVPTNGYASFSGTSMATPHLAASVALIWAAAPSLIGDIPGTRTLLDSTAINMSDLTCGGTAGDNDVWGEGRLDVKAALDAAPRAQSGTLTGTVTSSGSPINGAKIEVSGPASRTTYTDATGHYTLPLLPVGTTYSVNASAFGYNPSTANNVVITNGGTTTQPFALTAAPSHSVSGHVRDNSNNPIANATVTILNTPIAPATTDDTGAYSFASVPEGTYSAQAQAGRCTSSQTKSLTVPAGSVTNFDFSLTRKTDGTYSCYIQAPSYIAASNVTSLTGDDASLAVSLPSAFTFYGSSYTTAYVSTNGFVTFGGPDATFSNGSIPSAGTPNLALYPYWDDLYVDSPTASVRTGSAVVTSGTTSSNVFVIEWNNVSYFADSSRRVSFEVVLYLDGSGKILYQYKDIANDSREQGDSTTVGIENASGSVGIQYSFNEAVLSGTQAILFTPQSSPTITTTSLPGGNVGVVYSQPVTATGGTGSYAWTVDSGSLPPGLTLTSGTPSATLAGTPTTAGSYPFTLRVTDGAAQSDTQSFTVVISSGGALSITTASPLPSGKQNQAYGPVTLAATGGTPSYNWSLAGGSTLPPGLTLSPSGVISGTPTKVANFTFTVQVTDATSATATKAFTLKINKK